MEKKNKPEHIICGAVRVSIWTDQRKNSTGQSFESKNVTLDRSYKDSDGQWQRTGSMRENDIPKAIFVLTKAYAKIMDRSSDESDGSE